MLDSLVPDRHGIRGATTTKLRVVSISHSAVNNGAARKRYEIAAHHPGIDLTVVVPRLWHEYGRSFRADPSNTALDVRIEEARLTRGGPAKWYLHHYPHLGAVLRETRPDVIHLWEEPWSVVALQAARLRDRLLPRAALLLETDQNILRRLPAGFEQIRRFTLAHTDLLIVRGDEALDVARRCGYGGLTETVEYAIDPAVFSLGPAPRRGRGSGWRASPWVMSAASCPKKGCATCWRRWPPARRRLVCCCWARDRSSARCRRKRSV